MTLEELEDTLPNGLHDAEVQSVHIDYVERKATIQLSIFVGELDAPPATREAYRNAALVISGLSFAVIEAPDATYPFHSSGRLRIDACDKSSDLSPQLLGNLPIGSFVRSFFVNEWNSFLHLAGLDARISWNGETIHRDGREHYLPGEKVEL